MLSVRTQTYNCPACKSSALIFVGKEIKLIQHPKNPWRWIIKGDAKCDNCGASYYVELDIELKNKKI